MSFWLERMVVIWGQVRGPCVRLQNGYRLELSNWASFTREMGQFFHCKEFIAATWISWACAVEEKCCNGLVTGEDKRIELMLPQEAEGLPICLLWRERERAEFPLELARFTCLRRCCVAGPLYKLQATEWNIFWDAKVFPGHQRKTGLGRWSTMTTKQLCHFFQIICSGGKWLCLLLWTHKHLRKNIQNSVTDKYIFTACVGAVGFLAFAEYQW